MRGKSKGQNNTFRVCLPSKTILPLRGCFHQGRSRSPNYTVNLKRRTFKRSNEWGKQMRVGVELQGSIALRAVTIYRPETQTDKLKFLTFFWLFSLECHVCLSFVIKMRKMTKLRQNCKLVSLTLFARYAIYVSGQPSRTSYNRTRLVGRVKWTRYLC